jgi:hypothetical protein
MIQSNATRWCSAALALVACSLLASCDKVQEAVDQAQTEAAKLQAQAEVEAKKLQEQAEAEVKRLQDQAAQGAAGSSSGTPATEQSGAGSAATSPTASTQPATPAAVAGKGGQQQVKEFLAIVPGQRRDENLLALAALDEADRGLIETMELQGSLVTSAGIAVLPQFPKLKSLNLQQKLLTPEDLSVIGSLPALEHLDLTFSNLTDAGLPEIAQLAQLRSLDLIGTKISGPGLDALQPLTQLERLSVKKTVVTGGDLARLNCLRGLKYLDVSDTNFSVGGDKTLRQLDSLQSLVAIKCGVDDRLLSQLKGSKQLEVLYLSDNFGITDQSARQLGGCTALADLRLDSTQVSDATLGALKRLKNLKELNVGRAKCTAKGVADLQKALPDVKISTL